ncbi:transposase [Thiohalocapsa marina]|uniref:Transposase n=1 Tax=Thiohalocapsa marina TaxID=424902 RepID=A0A5M8FJ32_9GAMM|nr:transposase [Thiohalocapsa marina]KAA6184943.1 transposase [Thiohalocapsa marina]
MGQRRGELSLQQIQQAYRQRFDLEHFFRFSKHHLLLDRFQTPELTHEEHWWPLVCLAYVQLWLAAPLASDRPRPWERGRPKPLADTRLSPARVQRDFAHLIRPIGTPAHAPNASCGPARALRDLWTTHGPSRRVRGRLASLRPGAAHRLPTLSGLAHTTPQAK